MKRASTALALLAGAGLLVAPMVAVSMGSGGSGGGGMPGGMSGMQQQYDPAQEYQRGEAALQAGKYRDAEDAFEHVVDSTPRAAKAWLMLGMSRSGLGDEKGAEKAYERSVKLDDSSVDAHRELALSYLKLKQADKANAEVAALKARAAACNDTCPGRRRPEGRPRRDSVRHGVGDAVRRQYCAGKSIAGDAANG